MFHTLVEFMTHTKGMAYVTAFLFLVLFVLFWRFLTEHEK